MSELFPNLETVDPILAAVAHLPEFKISENVELGFGYISYMVAFEETFGDMLKAKTPAEILDVQLRREARGIKYDLATHKVIGRVYHKFFNVGERNETASTRIDLSKKHWILDKLDGSMVAPYFGPTGLLMLTKKGISDVGAIATAWSLEQPDYLRFYKKMVDDGFTPIFEFCSRKTRIVLDYPVDRMVLTGIRHNVSGHYVPYPEMVELGREYNVEVVHAVDTSAKSTVDLLKEIKGLLDAEGVIIRFEDGSMFKVKGDWYCAVHRVATNFKFEKDIVRMLVSETIDDAKPFLSDAVRDDADRFHKDIVTAVKKIASDIYWECVSAHDNMNGSAKRFAEYVQSDKVRLSRSRVMFKAFREEMDEEAIFDLIIKIILDGTSTAAKVEEVRHYFGGLRWDNYHNAKVTVDDE